MLLELSRLLISRLSDLEYSDFLAAPVVNTIYFAEHSVESFKIIDCDSSKGGMWGLLKQKSAPFRRALFDYLVVIELSN
jgi:hypothetical protein